MNINFIIIIIIVASYGGAAVLPYVFFSQLFCFCFFFSLIFVGFLDFWEGQLKELRFKSKFVWPAASAK